jgi:hypothetical protein
VGEFLEVRRRLLTDDHPLGAVVANHIAEWVNHSNNSGVGRFSEHTLALLWDAERLSRASTIMGARKRSSVYWWLGNNMVGPGLAR